MNNLNHTPEYLRIVMAEHERRVAHHLLVREFVSAQRSQRGQQRWRWYSPLNLLPPRWLRWGLPRWVALFVNGTFGPLLRRRLLQGLQRR